MFGFVSAFGLGFVESMFGSASEVGSQAFESTFVSTFVSGFESAFESAFESSIVE